MSEPASVNVEARGGSPSGAGDRGRTGTVLLPSDFESDTSANSITPADKFCKSINCSIISQCCKNVKFADGKKMHCKICAQ